MKKLLALALVGITLVGCSSKKEEVAETPEVTATAEATATAETSAPKLTCVETTENEVSTIEYTMDSSENVVEVTQTVEYTYSANSGLTKEEFLKKITEMFEESGKQFTKGFELTTSATDSGVLVSARIVIADLAGVDATVVENTINNIPKNKEAIILEESTNSGKTCQ